MTRLHKTSFPLLLAALLLFTAACATRQAPHPATPTGKPRPYKVLGKWYQPLASAHGYDEVGIASWYGHKFHGKLTASGEKYNMHAMTAAHKTLPLGTMVKVRHLGSGREVVLKINDRGPFVGKRIIDLSNKAAHAIGMVSTGTARVRVTALTGKGKFVAKPRTLGDFSVQVGSFGDQSNAENYAQKLASRYNQLPVKAILGKDGLNRVVVGRLTNREAAVDLKIRLIEDGFNSAFVLKL